MAKIETLYLGVSDPIAQRRFYCDVLGMQTFDDGSVGYEAAEQAHICFLKADAPYAPKPNDLYWKIALGVPNIELACQQLATSGVAVSKPHQFHDVGYLAHFTDPEGFAIELIDHGFEGDRSDVDLDPLRLGGGAHFNLITLRTADIGSVQGACGDWGMKPLSVQPLADYGFTLYFFAFTSDQPPSPDLNAVVNRTWLYQRPYTVLEVQHVDALDDVVVPGVGAAGYAGISISGLADDASNLQLMINPKIA